jgi:hypothetical protein
MVQNLMLAIVIVTFELPIARATHQPSSISFQRGEVTRLQYFTPHFKATAIYAFAYLAPPLLWSSSRHKKVKLSIDVYVMNVHNYCVHCIAFGNSSRTILHFSPTPQLHALPFIRRLDLQVLPHTIARAHTFHGRIRDMDCMCSLDDYEVRKRTMPQQTR